MSQVMLHLRKTQEILKSSQRAAAIEQEIVKFKSPNTKRNIKFARDLLFGNDDMQELIKVEEGKDFATKDNLAEVNEVIVLLRGMFREQRQKIQHEVDMQVIAATSPLKWKVVKQLEGGAELPDCVSVLNTELRKAEKETMAYERDLRNVFNYGKRRGSSTDEGGYGKRGRFNSGRERGSYASGGSGRGGFVSGGTGRGRTCWTCGSPDHLMEQCTEKVQSEK